VDIRGILNSTSFFNVILDAEALDRLAAAATERTIARGAVLIRQGDLGGSMFIVVEGKAAVSVHEPGGDQTVAVLEPGDIVGEISLLTGARRTATVTAQGRLKVIEIGKDALAPILSATPALVGRFATLVEQRQGELDTRHRGAVRWNAIGGTRVEIAARMTAFYSG